MNAIKEFIPNQWWVFVGKDQSITIFFSKWKAGYPISTIISDPRCVATSQLVCVQSVRQVPQVEQQGSSLLWEQAVLTLSHLLVVSRRTTHALLLCCYYTVIVDIHTCKQDKNAITERCPSKGAFFHFLDHICSYQSTLNCISWSIRGLKPVTMQFPKPLLR